MPLPEVTQIVAFWDVPGPLPPTDGEEIRLGSQFGLRRPSSTYRRKNGSVTTGRTTNSEQPYDQTQALVITGSRCRSDNGSH